MRHLLLACVAWLSGCSLIFPKPAETPPDRGFEQCPLGLAQSRKDLTQVITADGAPTPLLIHYETRMGNDRVVKNGQLIYFMATRHDADPPRNYGPEMNRHIIPRELPVTAATSKWHIEAVDPNGRPLPPDAPVSDGDTLRLRNESGGYLMLGARGQETVPDAAQAALLTLYKVDVPDSTRPSTCDDKIRDGDFVFVLAAPPGIWVNAAPDAALYVQPMGKANPHCVQEEERCYQDAGGGFVCAWAPVCVN
jgi:hypothetical protein